MQNTVLVVGGAGYIGSHMVKMLRLNHYRVVVADNLSSGRRAAVLGVDLQLGDVGSATFVESVLAQVRPDAVMHFASFIQVGESVADPARYCANNVTATQVRNGHGFSIRKIIAAAERVTRRPIPLVMGERRDGDPPALVADARHACASLGWQPRNTSLDTIIAHARAWEQSHFTPHLDPLTR